MTTSALNTADPEFPHVFQKEQTSYTMRVAVSMALYACLFFVLAFCGPYVLPAVTLLTDAPLADRHVAANQLLLLHDTVWVAVPVLFLGALLFSLLITRRVADAIERLGGSARMWSNGFVSHRIRFRQQDRLDGLAKLLNQGWDRVEQGLTGLKQETLAASNRIEAAITQLPLQGSAEPALLQLRGIQEALDRIEHTLQRFETR